MLPLFAGVGVDELFRLANAGRQGRHLELQEGARELARLRLDAQLGVDHRSEAPAEQRVNRLHRYPVRVRARESDISQAEEGLRGIGFLNKEHTRLLHTRGGRNFRERHLQRFPGAEFLTQRGLDSGRREIADHRQDKLIRHVMSSVELTHLLPCDPGKRDLGSARDAPVGMCAEEERLVITLDDLAGNGFVVLDTIHILFDHLFQLLRRKRGMQEIIAKQVHGQVDILFQEVRSAKGASGRMARPSFTRCAR